MSEYYDSLGYDKCAIDADNKRSIGPGNYALYQGSRVNPKFNSQKTVICENKKGCNTMEQKDANLGVGFEYTKDRVRIENGLRGTDRVITKCSAGHFYPCDLGVGPGRIDGECANVKVFNPYIHEHQMFKSNVRDVEYNMGFGEGY